MRLLFLLARLYPYWAIALSIVLIQLGTYYRRKLNIIQYYCWIVLGMLIMGVVLWIGFRGDLHSDEWVRTFIEEY